MEFCKGQPARIAVHGTGRMAEAIHIVAGTRTDLELVALVGPEAPAWTTDIPWVRRLDDLQQQRPDLLIDFTLPAGTRAAAAWCRSQEVALLSGVTGLGDEEMGVLRRTAERAPVLWSPNLSLGVNLLAELVGRAAAVVGHMTPVRIEDIHHQWKKDAPSGTALMLGAAVAEQRGGDSSAIEYHSVREGEVIGEHTVTFRMDGEEFDLVHRALDRSVFARGALTAGCWLLTRPPGMYTAADWLAGR